MTRRSLELTRTLRDARREGSLLQAIDRTCTPMGARLLADWLTSPLTALAPIVDRHEAVAELVRDSGLRADLRDSLDGANDLERLAARVGTGRASPRDLVALARTLALLPKVKARLTARTSKRLAELEAGARALPRDPRLDRGGPRRRPAAGHQGRRPDPRRLPRRPRRAARPGPGRQVLDRPVPGRAGPPDRDQRPEGRLQQGLRLLHRGHPRPERQRLEDPRPTTSASRPSRTPSATSRPS